MNRQIEMSIILPITSFLAINPVQGQQVSTPSVDSIPIVYEVQGHGAPALIFVHGWSCDRNYWKAQVPAFSPHYKVVTLDLAGHGASGSGRKDYSIELFGADVAA